MGQKVAIPASMLPGYSSETSQRGMSMRFLTKATMAAFLVLALVPRSLAQAQEPAPAALQGGDFASLRAQADAGDGQAQFALANRYFRGLGVAQDYQKAVIW